MRGGERTDQTHRIEALGTKAMTHTGIVRHEYSPSGCLERNGELALSLSSGVKTDDRIRSARMVSIVKRDRFFFGFCQWRRSCYKFPPYTSTSPSLPQQPKTHLEISLSSPLSHTPRSPFPLPFSLAPHFTLSLIHSM